MSILGLDSGYTVKYNPLPSGVPSGTPSGKGLYLTVYPSSRPNTDTVHIIVAQIDEVAQALSVKAADPSR